MRVRDRRALPREAACFQDGEIDVGRSAFVCTGGAESELGKGGKIRRRRRVLTRKKTTTIIDTRIRVHTNVSQSAEVKPTFYRRPLDSGMHVLRRRSSERELELWRCAIQLPVRVGIACW